MPAPLREAGGELRAQRTKSQIAPALCLESLRTGATQLLPESCHFDPGSEAGRTARVEKKAYRGHDKRGASGFHAEEPDVDPRVPTMSVVTSVLLRKFIKDVEAYEGG